MDKSPTQRKVNTLHMCIILQLTGPGAGGQIFASASQMRRLGLREVERLAQGHTGRTLSRSRISRALFPGHPGITHLKPTALNKIGAPPRSTGFAAASVPPLDTFPSTRSPVTLPWSTALNCWRLCAGACEGREVSERFSQAALP